MAHRNSYNNEELHHLYVIIDRVDDGVFKYGISCKPIGKDGLSERMREQINLLNRIDKWRRFFAVILIVDIQGKREARRIESQHIRDYEKLHGEKPRGNPVE
jgi:URI fold toxin 2